MNSFSITSHSKTAIEATARFSKLRNMKKRIRKKRRFREYQEWGVPIAIKRNQEDGFDAFLDDFIEYAIEGNECYFGGGSHKDKLEGVIELGRASEIEFRLSGVISWLDKRDDIEKYIIGNKIDLWHGSLKEMDETGKKI